MSYSSNLAFVEFCDLPAFKGEKFAGTALTIHPIHIDEMNKFINRLTIEQARRIIPLAFQMLPNEDIDELLINHCVGRGFEVPVKANRVDPISKVVSQ